MLKNIIHFLKYNNLATLAVAAALVGSGGAFAASPELRAAAGDALVGRTETVVAIDNAAILNADLTAFDPALVITAVSEDAERYLVSYRFDTFEVENGAWQKTERTGELKVAKNALGDRDLRAYVEKELGEVARQEIRYLKEAQIAERGKGETQKQIAVAYAGLLGLVIDSQEKELEPKPPVVVQHSMLDKVAELQPTVAAVTPSAPVNLEVQPPNSDNLVAQPLSELATTTDSEILVVPAEQVAATTTVSILMPEILPIDLASTTPVVEN